MEHSKGMFGQMPIIAQDFWAVEVTFENGIVARTTCRALFNLQDAINALRMQKEYAEAGDIRSITLK
jgi:hypothetical protein